MKGAGARRARAALRKHADPEKAKFLTRFFKSGPGEYAEGDVLIGVKVPQTRLVAREFRELPLADLGELLDSEIHEERLLALIILTHRFKKEPEAVYRLYIKKLRRVNNWDLVDTSAPAIVGGWLKDKDRRLLDKMAASKSLWERRVAMLATLLWIRQGDCADVWRLAEKLVSDREDLMHKAVGWMLREAGRHEPQGLEEFLDRHCRTMPRTMLRYAIEKLPKTRRTAYLLARDKS